MNSLWEVFVLRTGQTQILAQRNAFVFGSEQATLLQDRDDLIDKIVEPFGKVGEHDVETVAAPFDQPFLHLIGNCFRRADHGEAGIATESLGQLPNREIFFPRQFDGPLASALAGVCLGHIREWPVRVEDGGICAKRDGEGRDRAFVVYAAIEQCAFFLSFTIRSFTSA